MTQPMKPVPKFKKGKLESETVFLERVERETQRVILKAQLSQKYKVIGCTR